MLTDFSTEYSQRSDDELLHLATQRHSLTTEAAAALDAELRRRNLTESDRVEHQKFEKWQERREYKGRRRKIFGKRQFSWLELLSAFVAMGGHRVGVLRTSEAIPPETRLGGSCRLRDDRFRYRHSRVEVPVAGHCVLDGVDPLFCHSIDRCPCLGGPIGRTEPRRWEVGYVPRFRFVCCRVWVYQAITTKLLR